MKILTFILSLLMLFLSMSSCSDGVNPEDQHHEDELSAHHNHDDHDEDSCPIACACECCGIVITYVPLHVFELTVYESISTKVLTIYKSIYGFDFKSNIWQPPQLINELA